MNIRHTAALPETIRHGEHAWPQSPSMRNEAVAAVSPPGAGAPVARHLIPASIARTLPMWLAQDTTCQGIENGEP
jgi:hypothetical protein